MRPLCVGLIPSNKFLHLPLLMLKGEPLTFQGAFWGVLSLPQQEVNLPLFRFPNLGGMVTLNRKGNFILCNCAVGLDKSVGCKQWSQTEWHLTHVLMKGDFMLLTSAMNFGSPSSMQKVSKMDSPIFFWNTLLRFLCTVLICLFLTKLKML